MNLREIHNKVNAVAREAITEACGSITNNYIIPTEQTISDHGAIAVIRNKVQLHLDDARKRTDIIEYKLTSCDVWNDKTCKYEPNVLYTTNCKIALFSRLQQFIEV